MTTAREVRDAQINLRVRPSLKQAIEAAAEADNRSLNSLIETLLTEHLQARGFLPRPGRGGRR
jgi:hypothetical protein